LSNQSATISDDVKVTAVEAHYQFDFGVVQRASVRVATVFLPTLNAIATHNVAIKIYYSKLSIVENGLAKCIH
jgi:hypothetical protein